PAAAACSTPIRSRSRARSTPAASIPERDEDRGHSCPRERCAVPATRASLLVLSRTSWVGFEAGGRQSVGLTIFFCAWESFHRPACRREERDESDDVERACKQAT